MQTKVPLTELNSRMARFREVMSESKPGWELTAIFSKINLYYFTGTMQDGVLFIPRSDEAAFWVRRSYERAVDESDFPLIRPMGTYREPASLMGSLPPAVYLEKDIIPLAMLERFLRYFPFAAIESADAPISRVRAVKSEYELSLMRESGKIHQRVMEELIPGMLREGMSELDFFCDMFNAFIHEGHQGIVRWGMFGAESILGHAAFGVSSLYPTAMNSPSGNYGMSPAVPMNGNPDRRLRSGDLVYTDTGCGVGGYHTDKTMTYMFGRPVAEEAIEAHRKCVEIMDKVASMLRPGAVPSAIYSEVMDSLSPGFLENFMGFGKGAVKFIGHGIGLTIDEPPVIAHGFNEPVTEGMVFAVEPKKGIPGIGLVGTENTYIVTKQGGVSITGNNPGLIPVW